jgi:hypothetical protein
MPSKANEVSNDIKLDAKAAAGTIGKVKAADMALTFDKAAVSFLDKYRDADRVVLINMMAATYCSMLRDSTELTDKEKDSRWVVFNDKVFALLTTAPRPPAAGTPSGQKKEPRKPTTGGALPTSKVVAYRPSGNFENEARLLLLYFIGPKQFSDGMENLKNKQIELEPERAKTILRDFGRLKRDPAVYEEFTRIWVAAMRNHLTLGELHAINESMSSEAMQNFFGNKYPAIIGDIFLPLQAAGEEWSRRVTTTNDERGERVPPR